MTTHRIRPEDSPNPTHPEHGHDEPEARAVVTPGPERDVAEPAMPQPALPLCIESHDHALEICCTVEGADAD